MADLKQVSITRMDSRSFLQIGNEQVEIVDYTVKSSADGSTELSVVIKGTTSVFEMLTNLEVSRQ